MRNDRSATCLRELRYKCDVLDYAINSASIVYVSYNSNAFECDPADIKYINA